MLSSPPLGISRFPRKDLNVAKKEKRKRKKNPRTPCKKCTSKKRGNPDETESPNTTVSAMGVWCGNLWEAGSRFGLDLCVKHGQSWQCWSFFKFCIRFSKRLSGLEEVVELQAGLSVLSKEVSKIIQNFLDRKTLLGWERKKNSLLHPRRSLNKRVGEGDRHKHLD